jgi:cardiolipin synthase
LKNKLTINVLSMSHILSCFFILITLSGCGTLPNARDLIYGPFDFRFPTVVGARGELSPERSKRIIERLKRQSGTDLLTRQSVVMEEISGSPLIAGNKAELLIDGPATYGAMFKAIQGATDHINVETFIFDDDDTGRRFADRLIEKQKQGVQVNLIYDAIGAKDTPEAFFKRMADSGINVLEFNPVNLVKAKKADFLTHRDHRKILVVDGKIAFTGGVNISEVYSSRPSFGQGSQSLPWRDTHVQIEGPAVAEFQKLFLDTWKRQKGPDLPQKNYFPELKREGHELIQVIGSTPGEQNRLTYIMYLSAIAFAGKTIHLTTAYFVPDEEMMKMLTDAAKRGLDVRLIVPGVSDSGVVFYAGRSHYEDLLESGVKLYERRGGMLHAKTAVIDGVWSTVGSTNLDLWSFARNDEVNAVILGQKFATEMEALFTADMEASNEITPEEWGKRPFSSRLKEWFSRLFSYWL